MKREKIKTVEDLRVLSAESTRPKTSSKGLKKMSNEELKTSIAEKLKSVDVSMLRDGLQFSNKKDPKTFYIKMKDGNLVSVVEFVRMKMYLSKTDG